MSERDDLRKAYRKSLKAEQKLQKIDKKAMRLIEKDIRDAKYRYTKKLEKSIKRTLNKTKRATFDIEDTLQAQVENVAISSIIANAGVRLSRSEVKNIVNRVKLDKMSKAMRPSFNEYQDDLLLHLKRGIGGGQSATKLARGLLDIDLVKTDIPAYIREIEQAARRAVQDPKHYATFQRVLRKHRRYIDNLTRAGEEGFQELGVRRATREFIRDIQKASTDNVIDNVINRWARRKLEYIQKRVTRTETSRAYIDNMFGYAKDADHIKGVEVRLSESHPEFDICDELKGTYLFKQYGDEWSIPRPPHHPQCICYMVYLFYQDFLNEEAA
jgi:hypothetical protein